MELKIGQKLTGKVTGIQPYGIFVQLDDHTQGLVHISEVTHTYVENIKKIHKIGEMVDVVVLDIDEYSKKVSLSIRAAHPIRLSKSKKKKYHPRYSNLKSEVGFKSIEDRMPTWIDETLDYIEKYKKVRG